jgi:hypothetical protein
MSTPTDVVQRLYILVCVMAAIALLMGPFFVLMAQNRLLDQIAKECHGGNYNLFRFCFDKAVNESYLAFWQYLLPFLPAIVIACVRWVCGFPRPVFAFSRSWLYLTVEGILILISGLIIVYSVHDAVARPIDDLRTKYFFTTFYLVSGVIGAPFVLSALLNRLTTEWSWKILRWGVYIVLAAPIVSTAIVIWRELSRGS